MKASHHLAILWVLRLALSWSPLPALARAQVALLTPATSPELLRRPQPLSLGLSATGKTALGDRLLLILSTKSWTGVLVASLADSVACTALQRLHVLLGAPGWDPGLLYCCNPLALLAALGGSLGSLENAAHFSALWAAAAQKPLLAGIAAGPGLLLAPSTSLLLLVPLVLLLCQEPGQHDSLVRGKPGRTVLKGTKQQWRRIGSFLVGLAACCCTLCQVGSAGAGSPLPQQQDPLGRHQQQAKAWWKLPLGAEMQGLSTQPSMGMAWYLAAEAFPGTLPACHMALLAVPWAAALPLAACLHGQPVLLWTLLALGGSIFRPVASCTDLIRSLSVLPLLGPLLHSMPSKVFMAQSLLAALALQPALMHSWLALHLVNANFAFAACTLLAAWQVLLHLQLLNSVLALRSSVTGMPTALTQASRKA